MKILIRTKTKVNHCPPNTVVLHLIPNNWDDFGFKTLFYLVIEYESGQRQEIGDVKIGKIDQCRDSWTTDEIIDNSEILSEEFFSLGQDASYYERLYCLALPLRDRILSALNDVVANSAARTIAESTEVFHTSLMRTVSTVALSEQYMRILMGKIALTPLHFKYISRVSSEPQQLSLEFKIIPNSSPPTNIHVLIGRNGVGKTKLLNSMVSCIVDDPEQSGKHGNFFDVRPQGQPANHKYFSNLLSTSFSAFDSYVPPPNQNRENGRISYHHIGLKENTYNGSERQSRLKDIVELSVDFRQCLQSFLGLRKKRQMWHSAIEVLGCDPNFPEDELLSLSNLQEPQELGETALKLFKSLSSGHAIVLLTIAKIIERAEEKTLILMDEPENHLHPPLLSALIRVISMLLTECNGVAIIATHSPVVLQEVPKNCVWKIRRIGAETRAERPVEETFGENVAMLTRDVFQLEVSQSGFHDLLKRAVDAGGSYDEILHAYNGQIGLEGRAVLRALINNKVAR